MPLVAPHIAGLATLMRTPNPMVGLSELLKRPKNEKPYLLVRVCYPADGAKVPNITKKYLKEIDEILQRTMHSEDKFIVIYQSNAKLFIADIDLPKRQVTTKDLPAIP